ncbi:MAG: hypothetical protein L6455_16735 [Kiritimatiellae bacterium]|nr:hypothetical protein [Kiritimatiellia bacterium]
MNKPIILIFGLWVCLALRPADAGAAPVSESTARLAVQGWLSENTNRLAKPLPTRIASTRSFSDEHGNILYRAADLAPEGYIILRVPISCRLRTANAY